MQPTHTNAAEVALWHFARTPEARSLRLGEPIWGPTGFILGPLTATRTADGWTVTAPPAVRLVRTYGPEVERFVPGNARADTWDRWIRETPVLSTERVEERDQAADAAAGVLAEMLNRHELDEARYHVRTAFPRLADEAARAGSLSALRDLYRAGKEAA